MQISILPMGDVEEEAVRDLAKDLREGGLDVQILTGVGVPKGALNRRRGQYRATAFLQEAKGRGGNRILVVTDLDLYADPLNFVFGQAEVGGKAAVISLRRLRSEDRSLFSDRVLKEALHELWHNHGLPHCPDVRCIMFFSNNLEDTDRKGPDLCRDCLGKLDGPPFWRPS